MMDAKWQALVAAIGKVDNPPAWLEEFSRLSSAEINALPKVDNARQRQLAAPTTTELPIEGDYLDFLREQIQLAPRGPEWRDTLQIRLNALQPYLGRTVLEAHFHWKPDSATLYLDTESGKLFHFEIFSEH